MVAQLQDTKVKPIVQRARELGRDIEVVKRAFEEKRIFCLAEYGNPMPLCVAWTINDVKDIEHKNGYRGYFSYYRTTPEQFAKLEALMKQSDD